jgi:hypothetical protein
MCMFVAIISGWYTRYGILQAHFHNSSVAMDTKVHGMDMVEFITELNRDKLQRERDENNSSKGELERLREELRCAKARIDSSDNAEVEQLREELRSAKAQIEIITDKEVS